MNLQSALSIWEEKQKEGDISNQPTVVLKRLWFFLEMVLSYYNFGHMSYEEKLRVLNRCFNRLRQITIDYYDLLALIETVKEQFSTIYSIYRDEMLFCMDGIMNSKEVDYVIWYFLLLLWNVYSVILLFFLNKSSIILYVTVGCSFNMTSIADFQIEIDDYMFQEVKKRLKSSNFTLRLIRF